MPHDLVFIRQGNAAGTDIRKQLIQTPEMQNFFKSKHRKFKNPFSARHVAELVEVAGDANDVGEQQSGLLHQHLLGVAITGIVQILIVVLAGFLGEPGRQSHGRGRIV